MAGVDNRHRGRYIYRVSVVRVNTKMLTYNLGLVHLKQHGLEKEFEDKKVSYPPPPPPTPILNEVCDRARASAGFMIEQTYLHGFHVGVRICPLINEL